MSDWNFITNTLATDHVVTSTSTWEDWDLSSDVPTGTKSVIVRVWSNNGNGRQAGIRANGSSDTLVGLLGGYYFGYWFCKVDASRLIEIYADRTYLHFQVVAYSESDNLVTDVGTVINTSTPGSYETIDLSSYVASGHTAAIWNTSSAASDVNWRKDNTVDDTDQYTEVQNLTYCHSMTGVDGSRNAEFKNSSVQANYILGSLPSTEFVVLDDPVELTVGSTGSWVDVDLSSYSDIIGVAVNLIETAGTSTEAEIREKGSTDDLPTSYYYDVAATSKVMSYCGVDSNGYIQAYKENAGVKFYLIGYFVAESSGSTILPIFFHHYNKNIGT